MKKILIIDDDADLREIMKTALGGHYEIREAGSGLEGEPLAVSFHPDLVILDVMMESTTAGFDLARSLKGKPALKGCKILMLTNIDNELQINYKAEAGDPDWLPVDAYLVKPLDPRGFQEKVGALLK
jgi:two-component system, OmpR family, alkaline phosphatase synthesis response regulator PhoP